VRAASSCTISSMRVDEEEVRRIARLARLSLSDSEVSLFASELSAIIDYVDQIQDQPMSNTGDRAVASHLREDVVADSLAVDDIAINAPAFEDDLFVVPRMLSSG